MKREEIDMVDPKKQQSYPETINRDEIKVEKIRDDYGSEQPIDTDLTKIDRIIEDYNTKKGFLVSILQDIQEEYGYLTREALIHISKRINLPLIQVYRVATFYKEFRLKPLEKAFIENSGLEYSVKKDYISKFTKKESVENDR